MNIRNILLPLSAIAIILSGCGREPKLTSSNIDAVLKAMTLEEKALLVTAGCEFSASDTINPALIRTNAIERLGIPSITLAGCDTIMSASEVEIPSPLALASTWDDGKLEDASAILGRMARTGGYDVVLGPNVNIIRNPLVGEFSRHYSEEPLVAGYCAAASSWGITADGAGAALNYLAAANQKAYADRYDACVSPRALREVYLKSFRTALDGSTPVAISAAPNKINGKWSAANPDLLSELLRKEWKYNGAVIGVASDTCPACVQIAAGSDLVPCVEPSQIDSIVTFASDGRLRMSALDSSARNVLGMIVASPTFKGDAAPEPMNIDDVRATARRTAAAGVILLENRYYALPLVDSLEEMLVVYEAAADSSIAIKDRLESELAASGSRICSNPDSADMAIVVISRRSGKADRPVDDFELTDEESSLIRNTCQRMHALDRYVTVVLNIDAIIETASWKELPDAIVLAFDAGSEAPCAFADIISGKVAPTGHLTVTMPISIERYPSMRDFPVKRTEDKNKDKNKLSARKSGKDMRNYRGFYGHRPDGFGPGKPDDKKDPRDTSAKGPQPHRSRSDFMFHFDTTGMASRGTRNVDYVNYREGIFVGYRYFTSFKRDVSYPFGYGLGYTSFDYSEAEVIVRRNSMKIYLDITNTGRYPSSEVVHLYAVTPEGSLDKPLIYLIYYTKTPVLKPGDSFTVTFNIPFDTFASYNSASSAWAVDAGPYILKIGPTCTDIRSEAAAVIDQSYSVYTNDVLPLQYNLGELHLRNSVFRERSLNGGVFMQDTAAPSQPAPKPADSDTTVKSE